MAAKRCTRAAALLACAVAVTGDATWWYAVDDADWPSRLPDWADLDTHGYIVLKSFVRGDATIWGGTLARHWEANVVNTPGPGTYATDPPEMQGVHAAIRALLAAIRASRRTQMAPDSLAAIPPYRNCTPYASMYFHVGARSNPVVRRLGKGPDTYAWHTDLSYAWHPLDETADQFLNVYLPLLKPHADDANLQLLPFSATPRELLPTLQRHCSRFYLRRPDAPNSQAAATPGSAAAFAYEEHDSICMRGVTRRLPPSFLDGRVEPQLEVGDALLLRGDVLHATAPARRTDLRVALSVRALRTPPGTPHARACVYESYKHNDSYAHRKHKVAQRLCWRGLRAAADLRLSARMPA